MKYWGRERRRECGRWLSAGAVQTADIQPDRVERAPLPPLLLLLLLFMVQEIKRLAK
jgi:hypothetical protein